jgi:hypothetical protein
LPNFGVEVAEKLWKDLATVSELWDGGGGGATKSSTHAGLYINTYLRLALSVIAQEVALLKTSIYL